MPQFASKQALAFISWLNKEIYWKSPYPLLLNLKNDITVIVRINTITYIKCYACI